MRKALILLTLLLSGCLSPHQKFFRKTHQVDNMSIYMKYDVNEIETKLLLQSIRAQALIWRKTNKENIKPVDVYLFRERSIPCGKRKGRFSGVFHLRDQDIHVVMGSKYSVPSLYHELCHLYLHQTPLMADTEHKDPRWKKWGQEQEALRQYIRRERGRLDFNKVYWSEE